MEHIGRNATNYFKYLMGRYKWAPRGVWMLSLPPVESINKLTYGEEVDSFIKGTLEN